MNVFKPTLMFGVLFVLLPFTAVAQDEAPVIDIEVQHDIRGVPMVFVPLGNFQIGFELDKAVRLCQELAIPEGFPPCDTEFINNSRQDPMNVEVGEFYIDQHEVSRSDYIACVEADVCDDEPLRDQPSEPLNVPMQYASYYDAAVYCAWREARVPTEVEWEYAARGPESLVFTWGNVFDGSYTNHCDANCSSLGDIASQSIWDDGYNELAPVESFEHDQSWIGAYDLSGNVSEWASTRSVLNESPSDDLRVIKGGSYDSYPYQTAGWFADSQSSSQGRENIGFRCVRTSAP